MEDLPTGWQAQARCAGSSEWQRYAYSDKIDEQRIAAKYCEDCPSKRPCLSYALLIRDEHGVWGGLLPGERKNMNKYGQVFSGYADGLRGVLVENAPIVTGTGDPSTWDWSVI